MDELENRKVSCPCRNSNIGPSSLSLVTKLTKLHKDKTSITS